MGEDSGSLKVMTLRVASSDGAHLKSRPKAVGMAHPLQTGTVGRQCRKCGSGYDTHARVSDEKFIQAKRSSSEETWLYRQECRSWSGLTSGRTSLPGKDLSPVHAA